MLKTRSKIAALAASALVAGTMVAATETSASAEQKTAITSLKPGKPIAKEKFSIRGTLATVVARPVTLQRKTSSGWKTIKTSTSADTGRFTFTTSTSGKKTYRVRAPQATIGDRTYMARTTAARTVQPASQTAKVTPSTTRLRVGQDLTITGSFTPIREGRAAVLYFQKKGSPAFSSTYAQNSKGKFRYNAGSPGPGDKGTYFLWVKAEAANGAPSKTSKKVSFKVVD